MNQSEIENLDSATLTGYVRDLLSCQTLTVADWRYEAINIGRGSATGGVYRVTGIAHDHGEQLSWSMILKVLSLSSQGNVPAATDIAHPLYWKREALVYQSGLLDVLPQGLLAPSCDPSTA